MYLLVKQVMMQWACPKSNSSATNRPLNRDYRFGNLHYLRTASEKKRILNGFNFGFQNISYETTDIQNFEQVNILNDIKTAYFQIDVRFQVVLKIQIIFNPHKILIIINNFYSKFSIK